MCKSVKIYSFSAIWHWHSDIRHPGVRRDHPLLRVLPVRDLPGHRLHPHLPQTGQDWSYIWLFKEEWNPSLITIQREISRNVTRTKRRSPPELLAAKCLPSCNWLMSAHKHYPQNVGKISNFQSRVTESTLKKYSFNYLLLTYGETLIFQSIRKKLSV